MLQDPSHNHHIGNTGHLPNPDNISANPLATPKGWARANALISHTETKAPSFRTCLDPSARKKHS